MKLDYGMLKTLERLNERPLEYEVTHPIRAIERALTCGLAEASEPHKTFDGRPKRWHEVVTVSLSDEGRAALAAST